MAYTRKHYRRIRIAWMIISGLVAVSMILFLVAPFFQYY